MAPALFSSATPSTIFRTELDELRAHMPGVLDGLSDSVHDARVATRRIRELLPLMTERQGVNDDLRVRFARVGRALGRVRDRDVLISVLESLETRIPHAAPTPRSRSSGMRSRLPPVPVTAAMKTPSTS